MTRIAVISEHASPLAPLGGVDAGGQNLYVGALARHLTRIGYEVDVFTRRDDPDLPDVVAWHDGVRVVHVAAGPPTPLAKEELLPFMPAFADEMARCIEREGRGYDVAHANFFMSGLVAAELKVRLGLPFVVTFHALGKVRRHHQGDADRFPSERLEIEARIVREADRLIAECPQDEEDLIRLYDADPVKIEVVPAGFDPEEMWSVSPSEARRSIGLAPHERLVLHVGRMVPRKGIEDLIRGFAGLVRRSDEAFRLMIVGGDGPEPDPATTPELARLMSVAQEEGVSDRVDFVGQVDRERLRDYYSAADVFVTTPWYEPFGITPLESMACGTPVIGTNVGGIKFTVRDGETGYLVPPHDPAAVTDRLEHLLGSPQLLTVLSTHAVRRVNALFRWSQVAALMASVYERLFTGERLERMMHEEYGRVDRAFAGAIDALQASQRLLPDAVLNAVEAIAASLSSGRTVLLCGNGGSAAEAQHLAAELVGRFRRPGRPPLPAIALTTDTSVITAWANDASFDDVFARQVRALGRRGDVLVGLSTSGRSRNVVEAFHEARSRGITTVGLLGGDGGDLRSLCDVPILVPVADGQRVQEVHLLLVHVLSELIEERAIAESWSNEDEVMGRTA
jgi:D-inositol-3-phosphate glycosyltransferase